MIKTVDRFLDASGKITTWPKKHSDKELVIAYLSGKFEYKRSYHEKEVNEVLQAWHTFSDWAILRRELYERRYLDRDRSGVAYTRLK